MCLFVNNAGVLVSDRAVGSKIVCVTEGGNWVSISSVCWYKLRCVYLTVYLKVCWDFHLWGAAFATFWPRYTHTHMATDHVKAACVPSLITCFLLMCAQENHLAVSQVSCCIQCTIRQELPFSAHQMLIRLNVHHRTPLVLTSANQIWWSDPRAMQP